MHTNFRSYKYDWKYYTVTCFMMVLDIGFITSCQKKKHYVLIIVLLLPLPIFMVNAYLFLQTHMLPTCGKKIKRYSMRK